MAIIGTIRKQSGLAVIIIGVAIAAFVIGDFGKRNNSGANDIAVVNGESIPYTEYSAKVEEALDAQKENRPDDKITDQETFQIRQSVYDQMVKEMIMGAEYEEIGLVVSPEELFDQIQGKQPHRYILQYFKDPKTGMYDPSFVLNYLKQLDQMDPKAKKQWLAFEKAIKDDRMDTKFNNLVTKSFYMPKALLNLDYIEKNRSMQTRIVAPNIFDIPDSTVKLSDADYEAFYKKNIAFFYQEDAFRDLDFVTFDVVPSEIDRKKTAEDVTSLYKEFLASTDPVTFLNANTDKKYDTGYVKKGVLPAKIDSIMFASKPGIYIEPFQMGNTWLMAKMLDTQERPDTMSGIQCLVAFNSPASEGIKRTREQAKAKADSMMAVLKKNPEKLAEFARDMSDFGSAKEDGGELKNMTDGNPSFALFFDAGLKMKPKEIKVLEARVGYVIFRLDNKSKPVKKIKAAVVARNIEPSNQTFQDTYAKASAFAGQNRNSEAFGKAAAQQGLPKREASNVKESDNAVMGLQNAREVIRWAFSENTKVGDISPVFDLQGRYMVAILKSATAAGNVPLEAVKSKIEPSVKGFKKLEIVYEQLSKVMSSNKDLYAIGAAMKTKVDTSIITMSGMNRATVSRDPEVIGLLFASPNAKLLGPIKGRFGAYAAIIDGINEAPKKDDFSVEAKQTMQMFEGKAVEVYPALKKSMKITDSRLRFY
jgi:peptidyl-prolyl cis-trans isomerase D